MWRQNASTQVQVSAALQRLSPQRPAHGTWAPGPARAPLQRTERRKHCKRARLIRGSSPCQGVGRTRHGDLVRLLHLRVAAAGRVRRRRDARDRCQVREQVHAARARLLRADRRRRGRGGPPASARARGGRGPPPAAQPRRPPPLRRRAGRRATPRQRRRRRPARRGQRRPRPRTAPEGRRCQRRPWAGRRLRRRRAGRPRQQEPRQRPPAQPAPWAARQSARARAAGPALHVWHAPARRRPQHRPARRTRVTSRLCPDARVNPKSSPSHRLRVPASAQHAEPWADARGTATAVSPRRHHTPESSFALCRTACDVCKHNIGL